MKNTLKLGMLLVAFLVSSALADGGHESMDHSKMEKKKSESSMDHSKMGKMDHSKMGKMDHSKMDMGKMDHSKMDMGKMEKMKPHANKMFKQIIALTTALATDNLTLAQKTLADIRSEMETHSCENDKCSKNKKMVAEMLSAMEKATDIKAFRAAFLPFSDHMAEHMSGHSAMIDGKVLVYKCPMVNGGKGARWLQDKEGTQNPFYGSKMSKCGGLVH